MIDWRQAAVSLDGSHHLVGRQPLYAARFTSVLKYHEPGLAAVSDASGAYHIDPHGRPAYAARFRRTFGFYEGLAAATAQDGRWLHIRPDGTPLTPRRYSFCGNFQEGRSVVRDEQVGAFHVDPDGNPAYAHRFRYVGDYREGSAVVQRPDGLHSHVERDGSALHGRWFLDLDVFHKGLARARDEEGWHHVDRSGTAAYARRFAMVEPFYNGVARVETDDGALLLISEQGETLDTLRPAQRSTLAGLSADLVGFWRTQTIRAAVELGVFAALPGSVDEVASRCGLQPERAQRLLRALQELALIRPHEQLLQPTARGELLRAEHPLSLAPAALLWAGEHYQAWTGVTEALRSGTPAPQQRHGAGWFEHLATESAALRGYHAALASYARHDYASLPDVLPLEMHQQVLDAGGGSGELLFGLLRAAPQLRGVLLERAEVTQIFQPPSELSERCRAVAADLLQPWPESADAIFLARVLHDFADDEAALVLRQARRALRAGGRLYILEMILPASGGQGGLLDLNMLVMTGGRERTRQDFVSLLERAGLALREVRSLPAVSSVLIAEAR